MAMETVGELMLFHAPTTHRWRWLIAVGTANALFAGMAFAHLLVATIVAVYLIGAIMLVCAGLQILHALRMRHSGAMALWLACGGLYLLASLFVLCRPWLSVGLLTLAVAGMIFGAGLARFMLAVTQRGYGWGWLCVSATISSFVALLIVRGWPLDAFWFLGMLLALDLLMQGIMLILVGLSQWQAEAA
jgi:uncharacterized membrane protein HdeD (DUF308 family)